MSKQRKIHKKIVSMITLILCIIFIIPFIISMAQEYNIENNETNYTYIDFSATWNSNYTSEETVKEGLTDTTYYIYFTTGFNTTGQFKNFTLTAEDITNDEAVSGVDIQILTETISPFASISQNKKTLTYETTVEPGKEGRGRIAVKCDVEKFGKDAYNRKIKLNLTGVHEVNGTSYDINLVKILNINLSTQRTLSNLTINNYVESKKYMFDENDNLTGEIVQYKVDVGHNIDIKELNLQFEAYKNGEKSEDAQIIDAYAKVNSSTYHFDKQKNTCVITRTGEMFEEGNIQTFYIEVLYSRTNSERTITLGNKIKVTIKSEKVAINTNEDIVEEVQLNKESTISFDDVYTNGQAGITIYANTYMNRNSVLSNQSLDMIKNGENLELNYHTNVNWNHQGQVNSKVYVYNYSNNDEEDTNKSKITYVKSDGSDGELELNKNNMTVANIYISNWLDGIENIQFYEGRLSNYDNLGTPFFTATKENRTYTPENDKQIGEYYAVINGVPKGEVAIDWTTRWRLLSENIELNDEEKANIKNITRYQKGIYEVDTNGNKTRNDLTLYYVASYSVPQTTLKASTSFIKVKESDVNTKIQDIGKEQTSNINLIMMENSLDTFYNNYTIENKNPIIYLKLIEDFKYDYNSIQVVENNTNSGIKLKKQEIEVINIGKDEYLKIPFIGTYTANSINAQEYGINISFNRSLRTNITNYNKQNIEIYMQTDNGVYYRATKDTNDINQNGNTIETIGYVTLSHNIITNEGVELLNNVIDGTGDLENANTNTSIVEAGKDVTYKLETVNNWNKSIKEINIVSRLPFIGNRSVKNPETSQMETQVNTEFKEIKSIYKVNKNGIRTEISDAIKGYSTQETAGFDSQYTNESNEENNTNIKTIQIKIPNTKIEVGERLIVEYTVKVPKSAEEGQKFAEQYCVTYKVEGNDDVIVAPEPQAIYTTVEEEKTGIIEIHKIFEGAEQKNLSNIEFEITKIDENRETNSYNVTTNNKGIATQNNLPKGKYKIEEVTEDENYESVSKIVEITKKGETKQVQIENTIKRGSLRITKMWQNASSNVQEVTLKLEGTTVAGEEYSDQGTTKNGVLEMNNIPFGTYTITETSKVKGWYLDPVTVVINQNQKEKIQEQEIENKISYGTIVLHKEMPEKETKYSNEGVKLWIYGKSDVTYIDKQTEEVITLEVNKVVTTTQGGTAVLTDVPVGTYTIEELEMPEISMKDGTKETRYKKITEEITVQENKETVQKTIKNEWKTGKLKIKVSTDPEGPDLTMFTVRVHGYSYYTQEDEGQEDIDITIKPDKDGNIEINNLLIGTYNIEEINVPDGFEVEPEKQEIEIKYNRTQNAEILNKYTGKGTVKIIKTAEGTEQEAKKGIKFRIYGKDQAGRDVSETITTNEEGIATSNEIMAGNYVLEELADSVPNKYRVFKSQEIKIENDKQNEISIYNEYKRGTIKVTTVAEGPEELVKTVEGTKYKIEKIEQGQTVNQQEVTVDKTGKFELRDILAGEYKISQIEGPTPDKGVMIMLDMAQTEELQDNEALELTFILTYDIKEESDAPKTKVILTKEIVDDQEQKIEKDEEFEVKLVNVTTGATYNSYVNTKKEQIVEGLPYGTYEIEEREKIEYDLYGYRQDDEQKLNQEDGKIVFNLEEQEDGTADTVKIAIINKEDKDHGFGGEDAANNKGKIEIEKQEIPLETRT